MAIFFTKPLRARNPAEVVTAVVVSESVRVTAGPVSRDIDGIEARQIDYTALEDADLVDVEPSGSNVGVFEGRRYRMIALEREGQVLLIVVEGDRENFGRRLRLAESVIRTIRFR